ncbi:unnamed protein product [Rotaria socialis]
MNSRNRFFFGRDYMEFFYKAIRVFIFNSSNRVKDVKEGILVAGGQGKGNDLTQLSFPHGIVVDQMGAVYVADGGNQQLMRWSHGTRQGHTIVGSNGRSEQSNKFNWSFGLSFDRYGNVYVVDLYNHRVQKLRIDVDS